MFRRVTFMMRDYHYLSPLACGYLTAEGLEHRRVEFDSGRAIAFASR